MEDVWNKNQNRSFHDKIIECLKVLFVSGQGIIENFKRRIHSHKPVTKSMKGGRDENSIFIAKENQEKLAKVYI